MNIQSIILHFDVAGFRVITTLVSVLWQSSILLLAAGTLSYALRNRSAAVRHAVWTAAVLAVPLLPLLSLHSDRWSPAPEITVIPAYTPQTAHTPAPELPAPAEISPPEAGISVPLPSAPVSAPQSYPWAVGLAGYLLTVSLLLLWTLAARLRIRRWILGGTPVMNERTLGTFAKSGKRIGLSGEILLMEHPDVPAPLVCRVFRPVVVLPSGFADGLVDSELRAVALHELSHIKRRDTLVFALIAFVRAVFFFQPLLWIAARRVSYLAEIACDSEALKHESNPAAYAGLLTRVAAGLPARALSTEMAAGILFSRSAFFRRVGEILSGRYRTTPTMSTSAVAGITCVGMCILLAASAMPLGEKAREAVHLAPVRLSAELRPALTPGAASFPMHTLLDSIHRNVTKVSYTPDASPVSADSAGPVGFDYARAIEQARLGDSLLRTARGKMQIGTGNAARPVSYVYDHASRRLLVTVEYPNTDSPFRTRFLYDGKKTTTLSFNRSGTGDVSVAAFINPQFKLGDSSYNPFLFEYFFYGKSISEILSTRTIQLSGAPVGNLTYSRTVKMGNLDTDVFTVVSGGVELFALYLARQYLYRPVKMTLNDLDGNEVYTATCEYKATGNGMFFPDRAHEKMAGLSGNDIDFVIEETEMNIPLSEDDFDLGIPEGVKIADFRR